MKILDLHGKRHGEVPQVCHIFINKNWGEQLKIITGQSTRMKEIVEKVLSEYDVDYTFDNPYGFGYVIIRSH